MAGYIGTIPVPQATQNREAFTATSNQTSFATLGYTPGFIDVYLNGVKLAAADYTATNGSDVVLASGAASGDILEVVAFSAFTVADQTFTGDTSVTNLAVTGTFTSRGIDDNADAVAITIDSSENVGIGTSSPSSLLTVHGSQPIITLSDPDTGSTSTISGNSGHLILNADSGSDASNNTIDFQVDNSQKMRIDSSGNVGIGVTNPSNKFQVSDPSGGSIASFTNTTSADLSINLTSGVSLISPSTGILALGTSNTERMRIDSSGNVGIGTTSPSNKLHVKSAGSGTVAIFGDSIGNNEIAVTRITTNPGYTSLKSTTSKGSVLGGPILTFGTVNADGSSEVERMRIDSSGNVGIGTSSIYSTAVNRSALSVNGVTDAIISLGNGTTENGFLYASASNTITGTRTATPYIFYTNNSERMHITSGGFVGIGTSSPNRKLDVRSTQRIAATFHHTDGDTATISFVNTGSNDDDDDQIGTTAGNNFFVRTSGTERVRIDSSGNLLVGTTNASLGTGGIQINASGRIGAAASSLSPMVLNRQTSDGTIIDLRKDGTTVGTIGSQPTSNFYVAGGSGDGAGIRMNSGAVMPCDNSGNTENGTKDLGQNGVAWKDLYLSGGVYLGGTGSANKLDDYEEGTWTPAPTVGTASTASGNYTKIGRLVHVTAYVGGFSNTTNNEVLIITGLPFTGGVNSAASGSAMWQYVNIDFGYQIVYYDGSNQLRFYHTTNGSFDSIRHIDLDSSSSEVYFTATYAAT